MLLHSGDVVAVDFGVPVGSEPGFARPAVVMTADAFLRYAPTTIFVVPLTSTRRAFPSHVAIEPDVANGLDAPSTALVEQMRAVATGRCTEVIGSVGPSVRAQLLEVLAMLTGMS